MFVVPQETMVFNAMVPTVAPVQTPVLHMPTAMATVASMPAPLPVVLNGSEPQISPMGCLQGAELEVIGPVAVSNAVWSLYEDQVKPYGRILKKRLAEMALANGLGEVEVDTYRLKQACLSCPWLNVQDEPAGEWVCLLPGMPEAFIDATDPTDVYPPHLWTSFSAYLDSLAQEHEAHATMPGGRYACAHDLASRQLYFFAGHTLGQICQIVQLAISQKRLLGYSEGCLVPYAMSQSKVKEQRANQQKPVATRGSRPLAMWPKVREVIQHILQGALVQKESAVPLSNVKRMFRSQFKVELSETALGYSKLSELLRDAFLSDLCVVELRSSGYVMIPRQEAFASSISNEHGGAPVEDQVTPRVQVPLASEDAPVNDQVTPRVLMTSSSKAYHENECGSGSDITASAENGYSSSSEPECIGSPVSDTSSKRRPPVMMWSDIEDEDADVEPCPTNASDPCSEPNPVAGLTRWPLSPSQINQSGCIGGMIQRTFIHHPVPPPTPAKGRAGSGGRAHIRSFSVPKNFGSPKCAFADALHALVYLHRPVHSAPASDADDASSKCDSPIIPSLTASPIGPVPSPDDVEA
eukprot:gnl/MRDRNA2_/MRDRNA2_90404_c0_seq1.p1 gnl/MRDRNA2_/MRDRNA2_90404_c0~~gnl/MRDRNA2_/MRDRNA2_90404_c0_seq1.p1  ORF type:complete len:582 (+),score=105.31 gnl/MRDRNA2_/MRDRNA2_90404_c0_seq1:87-1832(+)